MTEQVDPFDVPALEKSVNDSAVRVSTIWVSFLVFGLYLALAAANVTSHQLLVEDPVRLPTINIDLPLTAFFLLTPLLFVVFHIYVLLQVLLLSRTAWAYKKALITTVETTLHRDLIRERLANTLFAQILAGSHPERDVLGVLLRIMSWTTLVILPLSVLIVFQFKFLPYHSFIITSTHRLLIGSSLIATVLIWPVVLDGERRISLAHATKHPWLLGWAIMFGLLSSAFLRFPGEELAIDVLTAHGKGINQSDYCARNSFITRVLGENFDRLIVRWENVTDPKKLDTMRAQTAVCVSEPMKSFRGRDLSCAILPSADLRFSDFHGTTMIGTDIRGARLEGSCLAEAILDHANLKEAHLQDAHLQSAHLRKATLSAAHFERAKLDKADFDSAEAERTDFTEASLNQAQLGNAKMPGAVFTQAKMQKAMLHHVDLSNAVLKKADLAGANLSNAALVDTDLDGASLQGAVFQEATLRRTKLRSSDLTQAQLQKVHVEQAELQGAILTQAQLQGAHIERTDLQGAILDEADLTDAEVEGAKFRQASFREAKLPGVLFKTTDFEDADLTEANLERSSLVETHLRGASLAGARLSDAKLMRADLSGAVLHESELDRTNFSNAIMHATRFDRAKLRSTLFDGGDLQAATFASAELRGVSFTNTHLQAALFVGSTLDDVKFDRSVLTHAIFSGNFFSGATTAVCDEIKARPHGDRLGPNVSRPPEKTRNRAAARSRHGTTFSGRPGDETQLSGRNGVACESSTPWPKEYELLITQFFIGFACQASSHYVASAILRNLDKDLFQRSPNVRLLAKTFLELDAQNCPGARSVPESTKCRLRELAGRDVPRCARGG